MHLLRQFVAHLDAHFPTFGFSNPERRSYPLDYTRACSSGLALKTTLDLALNLCRRTLSDSVPL